MQFTAKEAQYVLAALIARRVLRASQVRAALKWRRDEIRMLRQRLATLESLADGGTRAQSGMGRPGGKAVRRRKLDPRVRSLRRLQGRYMGFTRRLKPAEKAKVRAVREKQGLGPAIRLAASLARKG
jgi:hypothetical protein